MEKENLKSFVFEDINYFDQLILEEKKDELYANYKIGSELKLKGYQYFNNYDSKENTLFEGWLNMNSTPLQGTCLLYTSDAADE